MNSDLKANVLQLKVKTSYFAKRRNRRKNWLKIKQKKCPALLVSLQFLCSIFPCLFVFGRVVGCRSKKQSRKSKRAKKDKTSRVSYGWV
jgi:hypothetical protein